MSAIQNGMTVDLSVGSSRLLLTTVSLSVSSVTLSANRNFLTVLTSYYPASPWSSTVAVNFQAGTLLTSSGTVYNQLTGSVSLSNPSYLNSYYATFDRNLFLQAEGIIFILLSFILLAGSYAFSHYKLTS